MVSMIFVKFLRSDIPIHFSEHVPGLNFENNLKLCNFSACDLPLFMLLSTILVGLTTFPLLICF
jgi:hypothetical protein